MDTCVGQLILSRPIPLALLLAWLLTAFTVPAYAQGDCYSDHKWSQGQPKQQLISDTEGFCFLSKVGGHFEGGGESVRVYREDGSWWLTGHSEQTGVNARAQCVRFKCILMRSIPGIKRVVSDQFQTDTYGSIDIWPWKGSCGGNVIDAFWGDAATFVTGIRGKFQGGGEHVTIAHSDDSFTPSRLVVGNCVGNEGNVWGYAHSMFFGVPSSGFRPRYWGPSGQGVRASQAGEYTVSSAKSQKTIELAPSGKAACYLTHVAGKFRGGGEVIELTRGPGSSGQEVWRLRAQHKSAGDPDGTFARSRCYMLVQSNAP